MIRRLFVCAAALAAVAMAATDADAGRNRCCKPAKVRHNCCRQQTSCCAPAPVQTCCAPAPVTTCCAPAPTCCGTTHTGCATGGCSTGGCATGGCATTGTAAPATNGTAAPPPPAQDAPPPPAETK